MNPPDLTEDRFTRLWRSADASRGQYVDAIAELRERKRREYEASQHARRRRRDGRHSVFDRPAPGPQRASGTPLGERIKCERCGRRIEPGSVEWVATSSTAGQHAAHLLCPQCAGEVRDAVLGLLGDKESRSSQHQGRQDVALALPAQAGWFLLRIGAYALIGLAVFAFVAFLSTH